jgi:Tfp pilus assembly protein PilO
MFLLHYFLGPLKMFKGIYLAAKHLLGVSWIIAMHPYITSAIIVVLIVLGFAYSVWMKIKSWYAQKREREEREDMYRQVCELSKKVQAIEKTQKMMRNDQEKILKILRELKGDNGPTSTRTNDSNKQVEEG